jgi:hypothetical protein
MSSPFFAEEGNLRMIDDNTSSNAWGIPQQQQTEDFPSLPGNGDGTAATAERMKKREIATAAFQLRKKTEQEQMRQRNMPKSSSTATNERSRNFAMALGLSNVIEARVIGINDGSVFDEDMALSFYTPELINWAMQNMHTVRFVENRLEGMLMDERATSIRLHPMPKSDRKSIHALCAAYHLYTQSFDPEPKRYMSIIKLKESIFPPVLLSKATMLKQQQPESARPLPPPLKFLPTSNADESEGALSRMMLLRCCGENVTVDLLQRQLENLDPKSCSLITEAIPSYVERSTSSEDSRRTSSSDPPCLLLKLYFKNENDLACSFASFKSFASRGGSSLSFPFEVALANRNMLLRWKEHPLDSRYTQGSSSAPKSDSRSTAKSKGNYSLDFQVVTRKKKGKKSKQIGPESTDMWDDDVNTNPPPAIARETISLGFDADSDGSDGDWESHF